MERSNEVVLTADEVDSGALWYFWRMQYGNLRQEPWWDRHGCDAFGWWEGENPFKDFNASDHFDWDVTYLKSLDYKGEEKGYSEPQGDRAYFVVTDIEEALGALRKIATSFSISYEDGVVKLRAWNEEKPEFKACLMVLHQWDGWCKFYYGKDAYGDFGWKLMEYSYGEATPDPVWKDGKLVFGDEFSKTPEEFVRDMATL